MKLEEFCKEILFIIIHGLDVHSANQLSLASSFFLALVNEHNCLYQSEMTIGAPIRLKSDDNIYYCAVSFPNVYSNLYVMDRLFGGFAHTVRFRQYKAPIIDSEKIKEIYLNIPTTLGINFEIDKYKVLNIAKKQFDINDHRFFHRCSYIGIGGDGPDDPDDPYRIKSTHIISGKFGCFFEENGSVVKRTAKPNPNKDALESFDKLFKEHEKQEITLNQIALLSFKSSDKKLLITTGKNSFWHYDASKVQFGSAEVYDAELNKNSFTFS